MRAILLYTLISSPSRFGHPDKPIKKALSANISSREVGGHGLGVTFVFPISCLGCQLHSWSLDEKK